MPGGNEGPNWILFAGGAAVTALSYLIRRRQKHEFEDTEEDGERKSGKAQRANYDGNPHSNVLTEFMLIFGKL